MFLIPAAVGSKLIIRFTVTSQHTRPEDIHRDWGIIQRMANEILQPGRWPRPHALSLDGETEEETLWQEREVETQDEPSMIDKHLVRQNQRRAIRSMSCSAELPPTRPDHTHALKEVPPLGVLAKIPESPEGRRTTRTRLMKFHSEVHLVLDGLWIESLRGQFHLHLFVGACGVQRLLQDGRETRHYWENPRH
ncbi:histidine decarboxylase [Clarias magur]|uniref:Histidine decarboxylase n=1 Tax=Clarias magur TaxID=1594786 RepID=A0A8J4TF63_CLAMG|nr:histidine decarboxylase [Clarias magur]